MFLNSFQSNSLNREYLYFEFIIVVGITGFNPTPLIGSIYTENTRHNYQMNLFQSNSLNREYLYN